MTTARLAIGNDQGMVIFYDSDGKIISAYGYPHYDAGDGDWGYSVYSVVKSGDVIAIGDEDWPLISFVDSTGLKLRNTFLDPDHHDDYIAQLLAVGSEIWAFSDNYPAQLETRYVRRFDGGGSLLGTIPIKTTDQSSTPPPGEWLSSFAGATSWDNGTFYLLEGQDNPVIWQWMPGHDPVRLGSILTAMKGGHITGHGECRSIAMHGPNQLIATSYNATGFGPFTPSYAHLVRLSLPDLTVLADYPLMELACAGSIDTFVPRSQPVGSTLGVILLPFGCASDGTYIWTGDFFTGGEIWRINPNTGAIDLWNREVIGRVFDFDMGEFVYKPVNRATTDVAHWPQDYGPISLNVRDFNGFLIPPVQHDQAYQIWPVFVPLTGASATSGVRFDTRH